MKKIYSKITAILMLITILFSSFSNVVMATDISSANLTTIQDSESHIQFKYPSGWTNVRTNYVGYRANGTIYPAYCISHGYPGVDEVGDYTVSISSLLADERLWRAITAGFPYSSPASLGVETELDAYVATKQAIYCIILDRDVYSLYRGRDARGNKIVDAMYRLTEEGRHGTRRRVDPSISINKTGSFKRDTNNSSYYMQEYYISSNLEMSTYTVTDILGFPSGTIVTDMSNNQKNTFGAGEHFKVLVPTSALGNEIKGTIVANGKCKSYPVFFGATPNSAWQNYAVTYDPYSVTGGRTTFNAQVVGTTKLTKVERGNEGTKLSGAVYNIYKDNNNNKVYDNGDSLALTTGTTNSQGQVSFQLPIANYVAVEKTAPVGYNLDPEHIPFTVNVDNLNVTITARDTVITGNVAITKTDRDTGAKLSGADYNIYKDNNNNKKYDSSDTFVLTTNKTDNNGLVTASNLRYGNYIAVEKTAPAHYNLDTTALPFSITKQGETVQISSTDLIFKGNLELTKVERGDESLKLEGAIYNIYQDSNNNKKYDEGEKLVATSDATGKDGKVVVPKLRYGNYVAVEKVAPVGYNLDPEHLPFSVETEGQVITITARDTVITGNIAITKTDRETEEKLSGAIYNIYQDSNNNKKYDEGEKLVATSNATDNNGLVIVSELRYGNYVVVEKTAPAHYNLDTTPLPFSITKQGETIQISSTNLIFKGDLELTKVERGDESLKLSGAVYDIYKDENNNKRYDEGEKLVATSDATGEDGKVVVPKLRYGNYVAVEKVAPVGYNLDPDHIPFFVEFEGQVVEVIARDTVITGGINITKTDREDTKKRLNGAVYNIYQDENNNKKYDEGEKLVTTSGKTDDNGLVSVSNLRYGNYVAVEVEAPEFYELDPEHIPFTITTQGQIINIIAKDTASKGNIKIVKTSEDGKNIEGIQFRIKGKSFLGEKYDEIVTTNAEGIATLENIKIGEGFTAEELNVPEGYVKPENQTFNVEANKEVEVTFYNAIIRGKITLEKRSSEDNELSGFKKGTPLAGAEYTIYDENMEVLQVVTTGEDGKVTTDYIKYGKVFIKETKAPTYYLIDDAVHEMFIKKNEEIEFFEHKDDSVKIKVNVYKQGIKQTTCGQEIRYDFCNIENNSNVPLNNFYWEDNLPSEVRITSLFTGTYNQDLEYTISYKTNQNDWKEIDNKYSTQKNNYIDLKTIELAEEEYITDYRLNFGTTNPGFKEVEKPFILVNVINGLNVDTIFTNYTKVGGSYLDKEVTEHSKWSTCLYEKQIKVKKLPRTGY